MLRCKLPAPPYKPPQSDFLGWGPVKALPGDFDAGSSVQSHCFRFLWLLPFASEQGRWGALKPIPSSSGILIIYWFALPLPKYGWNVRPIRQNTNQTCSSELWSQFSLALPLVIFLKKNIASWVSGLWTFPFSSKSTNSSWSSWPTTSFYRSCYLRCFAEFQR